MLGWSQCGGLPQDCSDTVKFCVEWSIVVSGCSDQHNWYVRCSSGATFNPGNHLALVLT